MEELVQSCTHTHIQTSDNRVLPKGTGYITDVGMTGYYDGILGINRDEVIHRFITSYHKDMSFQMKAVAYCLE